MQTTAPAFSRLCARFARRVFDGAAPPSNLALLTAGAEWRRANGWSFMAKLDSELADGYDSYAGTARVRYSW